MSASSAKLTLVNPKREFLDYISFFVANALDLTDEQLQRELAIYTRRLLEEQ